MSDSTEMVDGLRMAHGYPIVREFKARAAVCARIGHRAVSQRYRSDGVLRMVYLCRECGCGLVQDRMGWRVRTET